MGNGFLTAKLGYSVPGKDMQTYPPLAHRTEKAGQLLHSAHKQWSCKNTRGEVEREGGKAGRHRRPKKRH
jgi:hypothetical protein